MELLYIRLRQQIFQNSYICRNCLRRFREFPKDYALSSSVNPITRRYTHAGTQPQQRQDEREKESKWHQAYPLTGYYAELPNTPPTPSKQFRTQSLPPREEQQEAQPPKTSSSSPEEPSPAERMRIVFGSPLASPGYQSSRYNPTTMPPESTWKTINGVPVPPRPAEPDNCCMSGCAHCVWDDYRDDVESWAARVQEARARTPASSDLRQAPRKEVESASISMDDDGGGSETNWGTGLATDAGDDLFSNIPVGIREFMRTEKKLKEKHLEEDRA